MRLDAAMDRPNLIPVRDTHSQSAFLAQRVIEIKEDGVPLNEIAVLYRTVFILYYFCKNFDILESEKCDTSFLSAHLFY